VSFPNEDRSLVNGQSYVCFSRIYEVTLTPVETKESQCQPSPYRAPTAVVFIPCQRKISQGPDTYLEVIHLV